jgi:hypothetical protein
MLCPASNSRFVPFPDSRIAAAKLPVRIPYRQSMFL